MFGCFPCQGFAEYTQNPQAVVEKRTLFLSCIPFLVWGRVAIRARLTLHSPVIRDPLDVLQNKKCTCIETVWMRMCRKFHIFVSVRGSIHLDGAGAYNLICSRDYAMGGDDEMCIFRTGQPRTASWISALPGSCQWQIQRWCWAWRFWGSIGSRWEQSLQDFREPFHAFPNCVLLSTTCSALGISTTYITSTYSTGSCIFPTCHLSPCSCALTSFEPRLNAQGQISFIYMHVHWESSWAAGPFLCVDAWAIHGIFSYSVFRCFQWMVSHGSFRSFSTVL